MKGKDQTVGQLVREGRVLRRVLKAAKALIGACATLGIEAPRKRRRKNKQRTAKPAVVKKAAPKPKRSHPKAATKVAPVKPTSKKPKTDEEDF